MPEQAIDVSARCAGDLFGIVTAIDSHRHRFQTTYGSIERPSDQGGSEGLRKVRLTSDGTI